MKWDGLLRRRIGLTCHECDRDVVLAGRGTANLVSAVLAVGCTAALAKLASYIEFERGVAFSRVENAAFLAVGIAVLICMIQLIPPIVLRARKPVVMEDVDLQE